MKIAFKTLGCRLNLYETDSIASQFKKNGYEIVDFDQKADIYVINTCTVTNQSDKKSRTTINNAIRRKKNGKIVVTGCMATHYYENLKNDEKIDFVVDNKHKYALFDIVDAYSRGEITDIESISPNVFDFPPAKDTFHTRSLIKIQDGCNNRCTYCIVPKVRGKAISRADTDIIENINKVLDFGYKEIVLTGVNMTRYRYKGLKFANLVEKILNIDRNFRLRIASIEPDNFDDLFFDLFDNPKLAPHLHLCIQSGSDKILKLMRRFYTVDEFGEIVDRLRSKIPDFNITTDIIVGFPYETDADFALTLKAVERFGFSHIHTFKYSVRQGTPAAAMPQIDEKIKNQRSFFVRELAEEYKLKYFKKFLSETQTLLTEQYTEEGFTIGFGENYIPIVVKRKLELNNFYKVKITGMENKRVVGELIN